VASSLPALSEAPPAHGSYEQPLQWLSELPVGAHALIVEVDAAADPGGRLEELGFLPGTRVQLLRRAPLGDPAVYALRGTRFCVRRSEARAVRVRALPDDAAQADEHAGRREAGETSS
jgi:ferrous iron transport protein A